MNIIESYSWTLFNWSDSVINNNIWWPIFMWLWSFINAIIQFRPFLLVVAFFCLFIWFVSWTISKSKNNNKKSLDNK